MKLKAVLFGILVLSLVALFAMAAPAGDVRAADGGCTAYINDVDVSTYDTPAHALNVDINDDVVVRVEAPSPIVSHKIRLAFWQINSWTVSEDTHDDPEYSYTDEVNVSDYAWLGKGLYRVDATAVLENGATCSTVVFIKVGSSAPSSIIGIIGLVMAIFGGAGLAIIVLVLLGILGPPPGFEMCCGPTLLLAIVLTTVAMITGGAPGPSSKMEDTGAEDKPQAPSGSKDTSGGGMKLRPRVTIIAIGCALMSAIGFIILFQQMGMVYPTITIVVLSLVLALVAGIVLPILATKFSRRR